MTTQKKDQTDYFPWLVVFLFATAILGFGFSIMTWIATFLNTPKDLQFCLTNECIEKFTQTYAKSLEIAKVTCDVLVAFATAGGVLVAISSYRNTAKTDALANHIAHFALFSEYIEKEVAKRDMLVMGSINTRSWYNCIFPKSRQGSTEVASEYVTFTEDLNKLIEESNAQAVLARTGNFRFQPHQDKVISHVGKIGISISRLPRNNFFDMEGQLLSLIENVNQSFSYLDSSRKLVDRRYI